VSNEIEKPWNVAIVTITLLDWPDTQGFPANLAIPVRLTDKEIDSGWSWPNGDGLQKIADRAISALDFDALGYATPYELRGVRWNHGDPLAVLPSETLMTTDQVNEMFARMRRVDEVREKGMDGEDEIYTAGDGRYEFKIGRWLQGQTVMHWDSAAREWSFSERYGCENGYEAACMHAEKLGVRVDQEPPQYVYDAWAAAEEEIASRGPGIA